MFGKFAFPELVIDRNSEFGQLCIYSDYVHSYDNCINHHVEQRMNDSGMLTAYVPVEDREYIGLIKKEAARRGLSLWKFIKIAIEEKIRNDRTNQ